MKQVDMSPKAVTARLKRVAQLRRLSLSLKQAKILSKEAPQVGKPRIKTSRTAGQNVK